MTGETVRRIVIDGDTYMYSTRSDDGFEPWSVYDPYRSLIGEVYRTSYRSSRSGWRWKALRHGERSYYSKQVFSDVEPAVRGMIGWYVSKRILSGESLDPRFEHAPDGDDYEQCVFGHNEETDECLEDGYIHRHDVVTHIDMATDEPTVERRWFAYPESLPLEDNEPIGRVNSGYATRAQALDALSRYWAERN